MRSKPELSFLPSLSSPLFSTLQTFRNKPTKDNFTNLIHVLHEAHLSYPKTFENTNEKEVIEFVRQYFPDLVRYKVEGSLEIAKETESREASERTSTHLDKLLKTIDQLLPTRPVLTIQIEPNEFGLCMAEKKDFDAIRSANQEDYLIFMSRGRDNIFLVPKRNPKIIQEVEELRRKELPRASKRDLTFQLLGKQDHASKKWLTSVAKKDFKLESKVEEMKSSAEEIQEYRFSQLITVDSSSSSSSSSTSTLSSFSATDLRNGKPFEALGTYTSIINPADFNDLIRYANGEDVTTFLELTSHLSASLLDQHNIGIFTDENMLKLPVFLEFDFDPKAILMGTHYDISSPLGASSADAIQYVDNTTRFRIKLDLIDEAIQNASSSIKTHAQYFSLFPIALSSELSAQELVEKLRMVETNDEAAKFIKTLLLEKPYYKDIVASIKNDQDLMAQTLPEGMLELPSHITKEAALGSKKFVLGEKRYNEFVLLANQYCAEKGIKNLRIKRIFLDEKHLQTYIEHVKLEGKLEEAEAIYNSLKSCKVPICLVNLVSKATPEDLFHLANLNSWIIDEYRQREVLSKYFVAIIQNIPGLLEDASINKFKGRITELEKYFLNFYRQHQEILKTKGKLTAEDKLHLKGNLCKYRSDFVEIQRDLHDAIEKKRGDTLPSSLLQSLQNQCRTWKEFEEELNREIKHEMRPLKP